MVKYGALFTCERCGKEKFVEQSRISAAGYDAKEDRHLCPGCAELYHKMMNNFFAPEVKRPINLED